MNKRVFKKERKPRRKASPVVSKVLNPSNSYSAVSTRDVYYFVIQYDQGIAKISDVENETNSKEEVKNTKFLLEDDLIKVILLLEMNTDNNGKQVTKTNNQHNSETWKTDDGSSGMSGYSEESGSFEDDGDCVLQSAMTFTSDRSTAPHESSVDLENKSDERKAKKYVKIVDHQHVHEDDDNDDKLQHDGNRNNCGDDEHTKYGKENEDNTKQTRGSPTDQRGSPLTTPSYDISAVTRIPHSLSSMNQRDQFDFRAASLSMSERYETFPPRSSTDFLFDIKLSRKPSKNVKSLPSTITNADGRPPRRTLTLLTRKDPKKSSVREEMERALHDVLLRDEHRAKDLRTQAQKLHEDAQVLREENRALKKLHRLQGREMSDMNKIIQMANTSIKVVRKDVRDTDASCVDLGSSVRKKNKQILHLQQECEKYEKLLEMDRKLPGRSSLEERLGLAETELKSKDKEIADLEKKALIQGKKATRERNKESRKCAQLQEEVRGTVDECNELKTRTKEAERKIHKTNIYSRQTQGHKGQHALPAPNALPAITWHPPLTGEQTPKNKVKRWLSDVDKYLTN